MGFQNFISHFEVVNHSGDRYQCKCPAHNDKKASLTITDKGDKALIRCHAGCQTESILSSVGLKPSELFFNKTNVTQRKKAWQIYAESHVGKPIESIYHHTDSEGNYICTKLRFKGKLFLYGILKNGRFTFGLNGKSRKTLKAFFCNDLPSFKRSAAMGKVVAYTEGEKDVLTLAKYGIDAVTCGSVQDWCPSVTEIFKGANVVIFRDNDEPGKHLANQVFSDVSKVAKSCRIINPCPSIKGGDITDYMESHTKEDLQKLIQESFHPPALTEVQAIELSKSKILELERTDKGRVLSVFGNYCVILEEDAYLKGKVKFDLMNGRTIAEGFFWDIGPHAIKDNDLFQIRRYIGNLYGISNKDDIRQAIEIASHNKSFHPVRNTLNNLVWDGIPRLADLFPRYLGAEKSEYTTAITKLLFNGLIQRVMNPGCKFDYCIIIADTKQGTGKSSLCRLLALNDEWFSDSLRNLEDNKKSFEEIRGKWIVELGEMVATQRAKDVETIKSYLSRTADDYRQPYGVYAERYLRQCVFIGTTNKPQFLPSDKTGNRRFIPIICDGDKAEVHPLDNENETRRYIKQCYAEAIVIGKSEGFSLVLDSKFDEELNNIRDEGTPDDTRIGMIQNWLDHCGKEAVCSRMIWDEVFSDADRPIEPKKIDLREIADIMNLQIEGWQRYKGKRGNSRDNKKRFDNYGMQRAWIPVPTNVPNIMNHIDTGWVQSKEIEAELPFEM